MSHDKNVCKMFGWAKCDTSSRPTWSVSLSISVCYSWRGDADWAPAPDTHRASDSAGTEHSSVTLRDNPNVDNRLQLIHVTMNSEFDSEGSDHLLVLVANVWIGLVVAVFLVHRVLRSRTFQQFTERLLQ